MDCAKVVNGVGCVEIVSPTLCRGPSFIRIVPGVFFLEGELRPRTAVCEIASCRALKRAVYTIINLDGLPWQVVYNQRLHSAE